MDILSEPAKRVNALVLCGGGSRGATEIGLYKALVELGISIDLVVGTSVGAINGALIASGYSPKQLGTLWSRFERKTLFPFNWRILWQAWKAPSLFLADRLVRLLRSALPVARFEDLQIPLVVTATDLQTAQPIYLDSGDLLAAVLASTALPPYLPPVEHEGRLLIDGGVVANLPIGEAVARGATHVFALLCHCAEELVRPPRGFVEIQARALRIAVERQVRHQIAEYRGSAELVILEPCLEFPPSILKLDRIDALVEESYRFARAELLRRHFGSDGDSRSRVASRWKARAHEAGAVAVRSSQLVGEENET